MKEKVNCANEIIRNKLSSEYSYTHKALGVFIIPILGIYG